MPKKAASPSLRPAAPKISGCEKNNGIAITANAIDASARYSPCSRSAGSAMSTPNGTAAAAATNSPSGFPAPSHDCASPATSAIVNAPTPTNVICASEICPAHPVSGTNDSMISAVISVERESTQVRGVEAPEFGDQRGCEDHCGQPRRGAPPSPGTRGTRWLAIESSRFQARLGQRQERDEQDDRGDRDRRGAPATAPLQEVERELCATPMMSPPANVHGRLRRRPMIAAANVSTMKSVSVSTRSPTFGARRIPAMAAIIEPNAHASAETRPGRTPLSPASSRLSTTARIATPVRLR